MIIAKELQGIDEKIGATEKAIVDGKEETVQLEATIKMLREQKDKVGHCTRNVALTALTVT